MKSILSIYNRIVEKLNRGDWLVPTLARVVFASVLLVYYLNSATTKVGASIFQPSSGAYVQIFPKTMEAVGYDSSQLNVFHWFVALSATWAEFILPVLILVGLFTRLSSIGMVGFIAVQSIVDITGHGLGARDIGMWFDKQASSLILDQRTLWVFLLVVLIIKGAGPLSLDRLWNSRNAS